MIEQVKITGTFLDEISHDIPHQNWGRKEWEHDFQHMKQAGIEKVILIRSGYRKFLTYPSEYLIKRYNCHRPSEDLVQLFLELSDHHGMDFYFGLYDSGTYWDTGDLHHEIDSNRYVIDEVWSRYGHHASFKGWYLSMEISRKTKGAIEAFRTLGLAGKEKGQHLQTLISPWIDGPKAVMAHDAMLRKEGAVSIQEHERQWKEIFDGIQGSVDIVAFQDGHVDIHELEEYLVVNKRLADAHGMRAWTNTESFDRDMPIKFLPIKFEKLRLKLEAAQRAGYEDAITFEFSHFMSPQSAYIQAHHLYNRYMEYIGRA
jgi:hypothetical protein